MITHLQKWSLLALLAAGSLSAQEWKPSDWPVLKHYDKEHLFQIALPLGGAGEKWWRYGFVLCYRPRGSRNGGCGSVFG